MRLKTAINIIRYATAASAVLALVSLFSYISMFKNANYIIAPAAIILVAALITLLKVRWIKYLINRVKYPGILYGVCDAMGFLRNLNINVNDDVLNDLYQPRYDTQTFLKDNFLRHKFYGATPTQYSSAIDRRGERARVKQHAPLCLFLPEGLETLDGLFKWSDVYSWQVIMSKGEDYPTTIEVSLVAQENQPAMLTIDLSDFMVGPVEMQILFHHYKYKYGYSSHASNTTTTL